jgi:hypothetical protein
MLRIAAKERPRIPPPTKPITVTTTIAITWSPTSVLYRAMIGFARINVVGFERQIVSIETADVARKAVNAVIIAV